MDNEHRKSNLDIKYYNVKEVSEMLGLSENTIRKYIELGKIKTFKPGRKFLIPESALTTFLEASQFVPMDDLENE